MLSFWIAFLFAQTLSAGHMNYQQAYGYHEINPIYGEHPSKNKVYMIKLAEVGGVYLATKLFPNYEKEILFGASGVALGFMAYDAMNGIALEFRF